MLELDFFALTGLSFLADMSLFSHSTIMGNIESFCNAAKYWFTAAIAEDYVFCAISAISAVPDHKRVGYLIGANLAIHSPLS